MKFYLKEGNIFKIDEHIVLELINIDKFLNELHESSKLSPPPHYIVELKYKLIVNNTEYFGSSTCDTYKGITSKIDHTCPYSVELVNWKLSENNPDKYLEFDIKNK